MKSLRSRHFRKLFAALLPAVQQEANEAYARWRVDPNHPSLDFKRLRPPSARLVSARVGLHHRVMGSVLANGDILWFWIGTHAEYDKLVP